MKIRTKLTLSNVIITVVTMIIIMVTFNILLENYISNTLQRDLKSHSKSIIKLLQLSQPPLEAIKGISNDNAIIAAFIIDNNTNQVYTFNNQQLLDLSLSTTLSELETNLVSETNINGTNVFAFTENTTISQSQYTVATLISKKEITSVVTSVTKLIGLFIIFVTLFTIFITRIVSKKIMAPIQTILQGIQNFSEKRLDCEIRVNTNDEFQDLAKSMNHMSKQLKILDSKEKKFFEDFSHDLKTPLTVINSYAEGLKNGIIEPTHDYYDLIIQECGALKKRIENMIYLSKLDSTDDLYTFSPILIDDIISKALNALDTLIIIKDLNIVYTVKEKQQIQGDSEKLLRVFENIFSNAIRYAQNTIEINCYGTDTEVIICIKDDGIGFTEEKLRNPFSRKPTQNTSGSGIGLSIVKKILDAHNGIVSLLNTEKNGACYFIKLPKI